MLSSRRNSIRGIVPAHPEKKEISIGQLFDHELEMAEVRPSQHRATFFISIVQESPPLYKLFDPTIASMAMVEKRFDSLLAVDFLE